MVEYKSLDLIFGSLSDPTRRDILRRVSRKSLTVSEIACAYDMSLAAVSKHLKVLEKAKLIVKHRKGKEHIVEISPPALADAEKYLHHYRGVWEERLDSLENYLKNNK
jgi:DNA-binding transcriptional ArsR family regulator